MSLFVAIAFTAGTAVAVCLAVRYTGRLADRLAPRTVPVPGLPIDGEPLSEEPGGDAEKLAELIYVHRNADPIPEPAYEPRSTA